MRLRKRYRRLRLACFVCAFALVGFAAQAEVKTFTITEATAYTNGDPLPAADVDYYRIDCDRDGAGYVEVGRIAPGVATLAVDFQVDGDYTCAGFTVLLNGVTSGPSTTVFFPIARQPNPPGVSVN